MSENPEYRHEKSENGVINNTDNDPELEPEIESHEQNVSHLLFFQKASESLCLTSRDSKTFQKFIRN